MAKQEIIITISPDGATKVEAVGYSGTSCAAATAALEAALGVAGARKWKAPEVSGVGQVGQTVKR